MRKIIFGVLVLALFVAVASELATPTSTDAAERVNITINNRTGYVGTQLYVYSTNANRRGDNWLPGATTLPNDRGRTLSVVAGTRYRVEFVTQNGNQYTILIAPTRNGQSWAIESSDRTSG